MHPNLPAGVDFQDVFKLAARMERKAKGMPRQVTKVLRRQAVMLETRIKANASGRPGPRAITGDYRRSWGTAPPRLDGGEVSVVVGTNAPQGRRLEFGFVGVDILGRYYNQPPFAHVGPAVAVTRPEVRAALAEVAATLEDE